MSKSPVKTNVAPLSDTIVTSHGTISTVHQALNNSVQTRRMARGWTQAELAKRAEVSRPSVSAIESGRLTPSVAAALSLARVMECSVEELFGRPSADVKTGPSWAWQPWQESGRYWEAEVSGKRLLYPVEGVSRNPFPQDGAHRGGVCHDTRASAAEITLTVATCDPAVSLLAREYARESGFRMLVFPRSGGAGLELVRHSLIHAGALHRSTLESPDRTGELSFIQ